MLRCDPTLATGFAPAELMIGRPLVYPVEFSRSEIDLSGTTMTTPLIQKLRLIRQNNFTVATKKIGKAQARYKKQYDKRMNAKPLKLRIGDKVQYKLYKSKNNLSKPELTLWCPKTYHLVLAIDIKKRRVILQDKYGQLLSRSHPFSRIRRFKS